MAERREHLLAAVVLFVLTVIATFVLGALAALEYAGGPWGADPDTAGGTELLVFAVLVFVGGMWGAWQLGRVRERTSPAAAERGHGSHPRAQAHSHHGQSRPQSEAPVALDEDRLAAPLRVAVEGMRRMALSREHLIAVTAVSRTEALVETVSGSSRLILGKNGQVKVERL